MFIIFLPKTYPIAYLKINGEESYPTQEEFLPYQIKQDMAS